MTKLQERIIYVIQANPKYNIKQVCKELGISMETLLINLRQISDSGIKIDVVDGEILRFKWPERNKTIYNMPLDKDHIKLGLLGDTHLASKYDDVESLNRAYDMAEKKQVPLRLSEKLYDAIASWAEDDFRSVNGQIEYLLTECVRQRKKNGKYVSDEFDVPPELDIK